MASEHQPNSPHNLVLHSPLFALPSQTCIWKTRRSGYHPGRQKVATIFPHYTHVPTYITACQRPARAPCLGVVVVVVDLLSTSRSTCLSTLLARAAFRRALLDRRVGPTSCPPVPSGTYPTATRYDVMAFREKRTLMLHRPRTDRRVGSSQMYLYTYIHTRRGSRGDTVRSGWTPGQEKGLVQQGENVGSLALIHLGN